MPELRTFNLSPSCALGFIALIV